MVNGSSSSPVCGKPASHGSWVDSCDLAKFSSLTLESPRNAPLTYHVGQALEVTWTSYHVDEAVAVCLMGDGDKRLNLASDTDVALGRLTVALPAASGGERWHVCVSSTSSPSVRMCTPDAITVLRSDATPPADLPPIIDVSSSSLRLARLRSSPAPSEGPSEGAPALSFSTSAVRKLQSSPTPTPRAFASPVPSDWQATVGRCTLQLLDPGSCAQLWAPDVTACSRDGMTLDLRYTSQVGTGLGIIYGDISGESYSCDFSLNSAFGIKGIYLVDGVEYGTTGGRFEAQMTYRFASSSTSAAFLRRVGDGKGINTGRLTLTVSFPAPAGVPAPTCTAHYLMTAGSCLGTRAAAPLPLVRQGSDEGMCMLGEPVQRYIFSSRCPLESSDPCSKACSNLPAIAYQRGPAVPAGESPSSTSDRSSTSAGYGYVLPLKNTTYFSSLGCDCTSAAAKGRVVSTPSGPELQDTTSSPLWSVRADVGPGGLGPGFIRRTSLGGSSGSTELCALVHPVVAGSCFGARAGGGGLAVVERTAAVLTPWQITPSSSSPSDTSMCRSDACLQTCFQAGYTVLTHTYAFSMPAYLADTSSVGVRPPTYSNAALVAHSNADTSLAATRSCSCDSFSATYVESIESPRTGPIVSLHGMAYGSRDGLGNVRVSGPNAVQATLRSSFNGGFPFYSTQTFSCDLTWNVTQGKLWGIVGAQDSQEDAATSLPESASSGGGGAAAATIIILLGCCCGGGYALGRSRAQHKQAAAQGKTVQAWGPEDVLARAVGPAHAATVVSRFDELSSVVEQKTVLLRAALQSRLAHAGGAAGGGFLGAAPFLTTHTATATAGFAVPSVSSSDMAGQLSFALLTAAMLCSGLAMVLSLASLFVPWFKADYAAFGYLEGISRQTEYLSTSFRIGPVTVQQCLYAGDFKTPGYTGGSDGECVVTWFPPYSGLIGFIMLSVTEVLTCIFSLAALVSAGCTRTATTALAPGAPEVGYCGRKKRGGGIASSGTTSRRCCAGSCCATHSATLAMCILTLIAQSAGKGLADGGIISVVNLFQGRSESNEFVNLFQPTVGVQLAGAALSFCVLGLIAAAASTHVVRQYHRYTPVVVCACCTPKSGFGVTDEHVHGQGSSAAQGGTGALEQGADNVVTGSPHSFLSVTLNPLAGSAWPRPVQGGTAFSPSSPSTGIGVSGPAMFPPTSMQQRAVRSYIPAAVRSYMPVAVQGYSPAAGVLLPAPALPPASSDGLGNGPHRPNTHRPKGAAGAALPLAVQAAAKDKAALRLQRAVRGWRVRRLVRGWTRIVEDGDIYWFHERTATSSWFPPGHSEEA